jgi:hypothetical protein
MFAQVTGMDTGMGKKGQREGLDMDMDMEFHM